MSTSAKSTTKHSTSKAHVAPHATAVTSTEAASAQAASAIPSIIAGPAASTPPIDPSAAASTPNVVLVQLPPSDAKIPVPPSGFVAPPGSNFRGITPKRSELAVLPKALEELGRFADYTAVFGKTAPPLASLQETLNAALQWSLMRNSTEAWDLFSRTMEGISWLQARALMDKLNPTFASAVATDATIATQNPSLAALLNAAKLIAQKGAATRKANAKAEANGEAPVRGKAAAKAKKAAKLLAEAQAASQGAGGSAAGATTSAGAAPVAPVATTSPTTPSTTNGAGH